MSLLEIIGQFTHSGEVVLNPLPTNDKYSGPSNSGFLSNFCAHGTPYGNLDSMNFSRCLQHHYNHEYVLKILTSS
jgi:hypothetical protein